MVKEIPRNGVIQCIEIAPNDLLIFNLNNVKNVQLETQNIRFNYRDICSKGCWNQGSPKVIQGHLGSPSVKNKLIAITHILLNHS